jgi:DNA-binding transcriptional LysR family regulator
MSDSRRRKKGVPSPALTLTSVGQALLVGEYLSFRRVATVLGIRQSAVSRRVRELEDELGVSLFERHHAGVRITNAGVRFLQEARAALAQLDQAVKTATAAGSGTVGRISIGILSSIGTGYLRDLIEVYHSRHPEVGIQILESASADIVAAVRKRQLDVAFITDTTDASGCETLPLWTERIFVVLPEHHSLCERKEIEWADLRKQYLIVGQSDSDRALCDRLTRRLPDLNRGAMQKLNVGRDTLMHLVAMCLGISLTTESTATRPFPKLVFRPIARNAELIQFSAAWLPHNDNPALRRFLSLARSLAKDRRHHFGASAALLGSAVIGALFISLLLPARSREGSVRLHEMGAYRIDLPANLHGHHVKH